MRMQTTNQNITDIPRMRTIKEIVTETGLAYCHVRNLCLENKVVHIKAGNNYLINLDKFIEYLNIGCAE